MTDPATEALTHPPTGAAGRDGPTGGPADQPASNRHGPPDDTPSHEPARDPVADAVTLVENLCRSAERLLELAGPRPSRLELSCGDTAVLVEWHPPGSNGTADMSNGAAAGEHRESAEGEPPPGSTVRICSPCVGTFYHAAQPGAAPFVQAGDLVATGDQVGLVEAMKLMTPVVSEETGRVVSVLVPDGAPVEYGQPLITLEPAAGEPMAEPDAAERDGTPRPRRPAALTRPEPGGR